MNINIDKRIFNNAYVNQLTNYTTRYNVFYGGAGSGKSNFVFRKMLIKALKMKRKILIIRKVGATVKDSVWSEMKQALEEFKLINYIKMNKTDRTMEFPNGSILLFKGLDDPEKIKSINGITDVVVEEATELTYDDWTQLKLRLRTQDKYTQFHLMFNPIGKNNWVYKEFMINPPPDCIVIKTTFKDNRFLPQAYIDTLMDLVNKNEQYYKIYVLGDFCTLDKLCIPNYKTISREEYNKLPNNGIIRAGLDFGFTNDPTALIGIRWDNSTRTLYVIDELIYSTGMLNKDIINIINNSVYKTKVIIADSAEPKTIQEIYNNRINIKASKKGKDSINSGIAFLNTINIIVVDDCTNVINELNNYTWQKDKQTGDYLNKPIDKNNHSIDAIRYAIEDIMLNIRTSNNSGTNIKKILGI